MEERSIESRTNGYKSRAFFLVLLLAWPALAGGFAGGTGEANDPYQIATAQQLTSIGSDPNDLAKHFVLVADIDLDPNLPGNRVFDRAVIAPDTDDTKYGFQGPAFMGVFDGQNYAIAGMVTDSNVPYAGLFGLIGSGGRVCNLRLAGGSVRGHPLSILGIETNGVRGSLAAENRGLVTACSCEVLIQGEHQVGGLVGCNNGGTISDCHATGSVSGGNRVGGLVGINIGTISACYSTSSVSADNRAGGLVGMNDGGMISACYSTGLVTGDAVGGGDDIGGLVGQNNSCGMISACYSTGSVSGDHDVGGLVGRSNSGTISACYSTGLVSGRLGVGGLTGDNDRGSVSACYSTGSVSGAECVGGLMGSNSGTIWACYSTGSVSNGRAVGGLVGINAGIVSGCFWDTEASGRTTSDGGTGLTTSRMRVIDTFRDAAWDFLGERTNGLCEYWQMPVEGGYPVLSIFAGLVPHALQGTGTAEDPYLLETAEDLGTVWCRPTVSYRLVADIDMAGIEWAMAIIPAFSGRLDGQGHRIAGLNMAGGGYLGLIGNLAKGAAVSDLGLEDVKVVGTGSRIGGLAGLSHGTVSACYSTGSISGGASVGGLVGSNGGTLSACHGPADVSGGNDVGGLVGNNSGTLSACHSTGSVSAIADVGGLVGSNMSGGTLSACSSTGPVNGKVFNIGGLAGGNAGVISACHSSGSVAGGNYLDGGYLYGGDDMGGLVGSNKAGGTISACSSTGLVSGHSAVGGLVGYNGGAISACYSTGSAGGDNDVGGLVGFNENLGTISTSYSMGSTSGGDDVGGLVGLNRNGPISACYSTGSVRSDKGVGGLMGHNSGGKISACFWDTETSGRTISAGGTGLPTSRMQAIDTFLNAGWDFVDTWCMPANDYPHLLWEDRCGQSKQAPL